MRESHWQFKLHHSLLVVLLLGAYAYVVQYAVRYEYAGLLLVSAPSLPIAVGFFIPRRSLEARFIAGIAGGVSFYFIVLVSLWLTVLKSLFPPLISDRGLVLLVSIVLLGAFHSTVISLTLYYIGFLRPNYEGRAKGRKPRRD